MENFFGFDVKSIDGKDDLLDGLKGKVVLAVNVASKCGLTPQYTGLEELHELLDARFLVTGLERERYCVFVQQF